jgi:hypothetical protein
MQLSAPDAAAVIVQSLRSTIAAFQGFEQANAPSAWTSAQHIIVAVAADRRIFECGASPVLPVGQHRKPRPCLRAISVSRSTRSLSRSISRVQAATRARRSASFATFFSHHCSNFFSRPDNGTKSTSAHPISWRYDGCGVSACSKDVPVASMFEIG